MSDGAKKKRRSGIPTGNAGEYFAMAELLRRGYDAQLADRNTKGYDLLVGQSSDSVLRKVQVKTVRAQPWYVAKGSFEGDLLEQVTIYVLLGSEECKNPVRYFVARNRDVASQVSVPPTWGEKPSAFMLLRSLLPFEGNWDLLKSN